MKFVVLRVAFTFTAAGFVMSTLAAAAAIQGDSSARRPNTLAAIYGRKCASCHGKDGRAETIKGKLRSARNLTDRQWQDDVSDERIYNSIMNGRGHQLSGYVRSRLEEIGSKRSQLGCELVFVKTTRFDD
jgi:mono/diheme cytochrome c family protein